MYLTALQAYKYVYIILVNRKKQVTLQRIMNTKNRFLYKLWFLSVSAAFVLLFSQQAKAQDGNDFLPLPTDAVDTVSTAGIEISLVTCEPYNRIYSLYGHTGLRIHDTERDIDVLANWGIFEMKKRFFILRFTFGLTDYKMEIEPWEGFCERYLSYGSGVQEQVLNLTPDEKIRLIAAVRENYKPENRYYRYNYFYDNCTTRVRDIIRESVDGKIVYTNKQQAKSFREHIHEWNETHLWARWGNDFLLGVKSDKLVSNEEAHFLPYNLFSDFAGARIIGKNKTTRPLVTKTRWAVPPIHENGANSFSDKYLTSPTAVSVYYFLILAIVFFIEYKRKKRIWLFDAFIITTTGIMGLVLFAMIFSQHPTVSLNFQILIFNPLSLLFLKPIIKSLRKGEPSKYLLILAALTVVGAVAGIFVQHYAEGVEMAAIFLLLTYIRETGLKKNETK